MNPTEEYLKEYLAECGGFFCECCADTFADQLHPFTQIYLLKYFALMIACLERQELGELIGYVWTEDHPVYRATRNGWEEATLHPHEGQIITIRIFRGYLKVLAERFGLSKSRISRWLNGDDPIPWRYMRSVIACLPYQVISQALGFQEFQKMMVEEGLLEELRAFEPALRWNNEPVLSMLYKPKKGSFICFLEEDVIKGLRIFP